jgi:5'-nucleotidase (lipoprotein e(P4) family)
MKRSRVCFALILCVSFIASFAYAQHVLQIQTPSGKVPVTHEGLQSVLWMQTSVEYRAVCKIMFKQAESALDRALKDSKRTAYAGPQKADDKKHRGLAVIVDIDESILDNSRFQGEVARRDAGYEPFLWNDWVKQVECKAVPGAVDFIKHAQDKNVTVFFITNRDVEVEQATRQNLVKVGIDLKEPTGTDVVLCKHEEVKGADELDVSEELKNDPSDKTLRRAYVAKNYRILLMIGDDLGDFISVSKKSMRERDEIDERYSDNWGEKWLMLPNPAYGSWDAAVIDQKHDLTRYGRLEKKWRRLKGFTSTGWAKDRRADKSQLTIMTFNTLFLWDGKLPEDGKCGVNFAWRESRSRALRHMRRIAETIRAVKPTPDIICLQEVENLQALKTLNKEFLSGLNYGAYLAEGKDPNTGQDVGLLSRLDPICNSVTRTDAKAKIGSSKKHFGVEKNIIARFDTGDLKFSLIGLHFKSGATDKRRKTQREAQAEVIRQAALRELKAGYQPVILGDFNDYDGDDGVRDSKNSQPITKVLRIIKDMAPKNVNDDLQNASRLIPKKERYTCYWDAQETFTSLDHILLPKSLFDKIDGAWIPRPHDASCTRVSDHYPVVVRLKLGAGE